MKLFLFIAGALTFGALVAFLALEKAAKREMVDIPAGTVFEVFTGDNLLVIGGRLEEQGLVTSKFPVLWSAARQRKVQAFVAGRYRLSGAMTPAQIVEALTGGQALSRDIRVTFPEGFTAEQFATRLVAAGLPGADVATLIRSPKPEWRTEFGFLAELPSQRTLEGFLFPDTYYFAPDATAEAVLEKILTNFSERVDAELRQALAAQVGSLYRGVTLASIVEHEVRSEHDRKMVSDLFLRRLAIGQALQSDATVKYILGEDKIQHSLEEIQTPSLYNTYLHPGLPPGPISNPGLVSLRAVAYPEPNPYFYFLNNPTTGETVFAETFEQHVRNKAQNGL